MAMWKKVLGGLLGLLILSVLGFVGWVEATYDQTFDDVPLPALKASTDPAIIARGEYLVTGPAHCSNCHVGSFEEFMQADAGKKLPMTGGWTFAMGPLGEITTQNLTPDKETGIGRFSDGQLFRMLRSNVKPNGRPSMAPMMPFSGMADEDHVAIVSYLRSLPAVKKQNPEPQWGFMGKMIQAMGPPAFRPITGQDIPAKAPAMAPTAERGEYIARYVANCWGCHSPINPVNGELTGPEFSGNSQGEPHPIHKVILRMPNLTPHETGVLKNYPTAEAWIARFRAGRAVPESFMHWGPFSRMSDEDLHALWVFFNTLEPVDHLVTPIVERMD